MFSNWPSDAHGNNKKKEKEKEKRVYSAKRPPSSLALRH
jgi:hypothetical protein